MATKHDEFDDFFGDDDTPLVDTRADGRLYRVPLGRIAPNLVNPRQDFGTEDELIDFGKSLARRQNQPCPVVSRNAYLKLWPDHADRIKDVDYVLVSGERRYRAANAVGLPVLDCVVNDDFAKDRKMFMEAVVSENVDRQNFDPVEEAYAVQSLVREFGSNRAVAQHFERVDGWVTQRILLTYLAPAIQALVRKKAMPLEAARKLGKLARDDDWDVAQQAAWWEEEQERRASAAEARAAAKNAAKAQPVTPPAQPARTLAPPAADADPVAGTEESGESSFTAVKLQRPPEPAPAWVPQPTTTHYGVMAPDPPAGKAEQPASEPAYIPSPAQPAVAANSPDPSRSAPTTRPKQSPAAVDWTDPESVARMLRSRMDPEHIPVLVALLA